MANLLIVDDDAFICDAMRRILGRMGHAAKSGSTLAEARTLLLEEAFDVVFLDLRLPDGNGLTLMPEIKASPSSPETIIVTGADDPAGAELAIKSGAWDFIQKPITLKSITLPLTRALEYRAQKIAKPPRTVLKREGIVGVSPAIRACLDQVAHAADTDAGVLITGETGTGKEIFARAIHANSKRSNNNFVVVDCAALPETLVESVLFGHVKGAFTGADRDRDGLVLQADGGTLFLDEIGELSSSIQKTFLRVLQERRFRAVGAKKESESDFRLVAATNRDLKAMAESGSFRNDLLYRLQTMVIALPPLRERAPDVKHLTFAYMNRLCERYRLPTKGFSEEFFESLAAYTWPGNIRELFHTLERILLQHRNEPVLYPMHLPDEIRIQVIKARTDPDGAAPAPRRTAPAAAAPEQPASPYLEPRDEAPPPWKTYRRQALAAAEEAYLKQLMRHALGNVSRAADISGLSQSRLYDLLRKYNLPTRL